MTDDDNIRHKSKPAREHKFCEKGRLLIHEKLGCGMDTIMASEKEVPGHCLLQAM